jgi:hypothetical protein
MNKIRTVVLLLAIIFVLVQAISSLNFQGLQQKFELPEGSQEVVQYYIDRKAEAKPISASKLYVTLYKYLNTENLTAQQKANVIKAIAYISTGTMDEQALNSKIGEIKRGLGKLNVLVTEEGIEDIDDLR